MIILIILISIAFGTSITSCQNINSDGTYYLANNLVSSGNCIIVNAQNVVIDGQGYSITSSGHGIIINVSSFNISIVNVNISSNQNNIYREGFVENSTITIYNSTLISNGTNLLVRNQSHSVNNLSIEIQNSTLNSTANNIHFTVNKSSDNIIRIVNSSMYANNNNNIVPNSYSNGSIENLVLEILNSTLNSSNGHNIVFYTNKSSNNTIRIVNSSMYARIRNIEQVYSNSSMENLVIEILNSTLNSLGNNNIHFFINTFSNSSIKIVNSSLYANLTNIAPNAYENGSVENLVLEVVNSTLHGSNSNNIFFGVNTSSNNTIRIVNSYVYVKTTNIIASRHSNSSVENLVIEILNSTLNSSNSNNIYFHTNKSSNNTIRIVNSSMYANHSNILSDIYSNGSLENSVLEILDSILNASNYHNIYFSINKSSNNTIRIVNSSMYSNQRNIGKSHSNGSLENLVLEILNSTLNSSNNNNIHFSINKSSNNTIRIVNSYVYARFTNIVPNAHSNSSMENSVLEILNSTLNALNSNNIYFHTNKSSNNTIRIVNSYIYTTGGNIVPNSHPNGSLENLVLEIVDSTINASRDLNIYFSINTSSNNTIRILNSSMYANHTNIVLNNYSNSSVENSVLEILNSTLNALNTNINFSINKSSNNIIRITNSSMYSKWGNIIPNNYSNGSMENLVLEILNSTLNSSNGSNIHFSINKSSNNTIRIVNSSMYANHSNIVPNNYLNGSVENLVLEIVDSNLNASNYHNINFSINKSSNNTIRILNSSMYANYSNIVPNFHSSSSVENLVLEIIDSTLSSSIYRNVHFYTNRSLNNTIKIVNSSLYANDANIIPNNYLSDSAENLVIEIINSTLNASGYNIYFYTNTSSNNTIRMINSSLYANHSNIVPNNNPNSSVENLVIEIVNSILNASNYHNINFYTNISSNNTIRIVNSSMYARIRNIEQIYSNGSMENLVIEILNSTLNSLGNNNIHFFINRSSNNTIRIVNSSLYANRSNIVPNNYLNGSVENLVIEIVDSTLNSSNSSNLVINNNESKNTFIKINNSRLLAYGYGHNIHYMNNFNYNNHLKILNSELKGMIYSNIKFGPEISLSTNINNSVEVFNSTILTLSGTNIFYANGTNIGNNITIDLSRIYSFGHVGDTITYGNNIYFLSNSVNLNNIVQINDSILESNYTNIRFNDSNSSTNRNNTVIILRSNLSSNNTNFLLRSLNKTLNDYNVLIVNTSLIGNVSFNLTESTLNLYGFNNLFLSDQHFVNSSANISGILNISKTLGTSIIGTPYLGGNYWKGYSDLCPDFDGDGLCELPYVVSSSAIDYLPLTNHTQHGTVLSGNFSTNAIPLFNISINVSPSINYTIYLYINGTLYNSTSGSGVGNYSLGATLGSGNYTYWFVVDYTIGGFDYSYTYGNYSAYVDIGLPSISILWPVDGESYTKGNRIIQILVMDDLSPTLSCELNVTGPDSFNHAFTISNGYVYNYSYNFNSLGLYTMNVSCNDGINQNQTSITFRIRESGGDSNTNDAINGSNSDLNQNNNTLSDTMNGSNNDLNHSNNNFNNTMNNSNMNDTNQSIENNTTMNNNQSNTMNESGNVNNQGQANEHRTKSRTQQSDLEQSENQTIQQNESQIIQEQTILNQTEEEPYSEEPAKDTEESKNVSQQDLISRINNYISIGLSEMIKLSSPFPYLLIGSIILLLSRIIKLKIIPLQDRVILQFNNILDKPIKNLKVNIDGQELITDENGQIILPELPDEKNIKVKLFILTKNKKI